MRRSDIVNAVLSGKGFWGVVAGGLFVGLTVEVVKWGFLKSEPVVVVVQTAPAIEPQSSQSEPAIATEQAMAPISQSEEMMPEHVLQASSALIPQMRPVSPEDAAVDAAFPGPRADAASDTPQIDESASVAAVVQDAVLPAARSEQSSWTPEKNVMLFESQQHFVCPDAVPFMFTVDKIGSSAAQSIRVNDASGQKTQVQVGAIMELSPECRLKLDATGKTLSFFGRFTFMEKS